MQYDVISKLGTEPQNKNAAFEISTNNLTPTHVASFGFVWHAKNFSV